MLVPVYDIVNCGPRHRFVANGKLVHNSDSVNLQNLPSRDKKKKALKNAIMAPPGHYVINCDSSQIEARVLAWLAGQDDVTKAFTEKRDIYCEDASKVYGRQITKADPVERFVGKTMRLGLGYGTGAKKLQHTLKTQPPGADLSEDECKRIVNTWREANHMITALWAECDSTLPHLSSWPSNLKPYTIGKHKVLWATPAGIRLPNELFIRYPELRLSDKKYVYKSRKGPISIWGGAMVENCIAAGTEVLTDRGWVQIESVRNSDRIHDGIEFVDHGGLVFKSVQSCVTVDGVYMTPDHEVLTDDGWRIAAQNPRPYRPDLRLVDGYSARTQRWQEMAVAVSVRLWQTVRKAWGRCTSWESPTSLRLQNRAVTVSPSNSRHESTSSLCRVSQHDRPLQTAIPPSMEKLWRTGYYRVRKMATGFRVFLGRYERDISARLGFGSRRQQWTLQPQELSVGFSPYERDEPENHYQADRCSDVSHDYRTFAINNLLSNKTWMDFERSRPRTLPSKPVYDILNAGPRQRFVVRGATGPFIVHNCVQALARIIVGEQMLKLRERYRPVLTVHDAAVMVVPKDEIDEALAFITKVMSTPPDWAAGLPVACEAKYGESYGDC